MQQRLFFIVVLAFFICGQSHAQDKVKLPEPNFLNEQLSAQLLNQTKALSDPSLIKAQSELLRAQYQALIEAGFSKEEALQIVIAIASRDKN
jgi:hypothetical protein